MIDEATRIEDREVYRDGPLRILMRAYDETVGGYRAALWSDEARVPYWEGPFRDTRAAAEADIERLECAGGRVLALFGLMCEVGVADDALNHAPRRSASAIAPDVRALWVADRTEAGRLVGGLLDSLRSYVTAIVEGNR